MPVDPVSLTALAPAAAPPVTVKADEPPKVMDLCDSDGDGDGAAGAGGDGSGGAAGVLTLVAPEHWQQLAAVEHRKNRVNCCWEAGYRPPPAGYIRSTPSKHVEDCQRHGALCLPSSARSLIAAAQQLGAHMPPARLLRS